MLSTRSLCPSRICSARDPVQTLVDRKQAELVEEPSIAGAILCSGCGCVWVRSEYGGARVLGNLRRSAKGYVWQSPYRR
jgi:hypothetical protein